LGGEVDEATERLATSIKVRNASLTASSVGKAAATSGLRRIRFVPSSYA